MISLYGNVSVGNVPGAAADVAGLTYDVIATATPFVPAGASNTIKQYRLERVLLRVVNGAENLQSSMRKVLLDNKTDKLRIIRYAVSVFDDAHHIIPAKAPPISWGRDLWNDVECIRNAATTAGVKLDEAMNGVSLTSSYHRFKNGIGGNANTLQRWYYEEVIQRFKGGREGRLHQENR